MAKDKLIYASAARKAILDADPRLAYCIDEIPGVEVAEMPKGKPGDYIVWETGVGERLYEIKAVVICRDGIRYELGYFCPFVNHPKISAIVSREEAERMMSDGK